MMSDLLNITAALLSLAFRIVTAPLLLLLYVILGVYLMFKRVGNFKIALPSFSFSPRRLLFPFQLKRVFSFSKT